VSKVAGLHHQRRGEWAQQVAAAWLIEHGMLVAYAGGGAQGPFDLVAVNPNTGRRTLFDVKLTRIRNERTGTRSKRPVLSTLQKKLGVKFLYVTHAGEVRRH
jgi:hypothetical protein